MILTEAFKISTDQLRSSKVDLLSPSNLVITQSLFELYEF
jgi:hypothetical protein